jgi:hypothetical protein
MAFTFGDADDAADSNDLLGRECAADELNNSLHLETEQELAQLEQELGTPIVCELEGCPHQNFAEDLAILDLLLGEEVEEEPVNDSMECDEIEEEKQAGAPLCPDAEVGAQGIQFAGEEMEEGEDSEDNSFTFPAPQPVPCLHNLSGSAALQDVCWMRASGGIARGCSEEGVAESEPTGIPVGWPLGLLAAQLSCSSAVTGTASDNVIVALVCNLQMHHMGAHHRAFYNRVYITHHLLFQRQTEPWQPGGAQADPWLVDDAEAELIIPQQEREEHQEEAAICSIDLMQASTQVHENPLFLQSRRSRMSLRRTSLTTGTAESSLATIDESMDESLAGIVLEEARDNPCASHDKQPPKSAQQQDECVQAGGGAVSESEQEPEIDLPCRRAVRGGEEVILTRDQVDEIVRRAALEAVTIAQQQSLGALSKGAASQPCAEGDCCAVSTGASEGESPCEMEEWELVWDCLAHGGPSRRHSYSTVMAVEARTRQEKEGWGPSASDKLDEAEFEKLLSPIKEPQTPPIQECHVRRQESSPSEGEHQIHRRKLFGFNESEEEPEEEVGIITAFLQDHLPSESAGDVATLPSCAVDQAYPAPFRSNTQEDEVMAGGQVDATGPLTALLSAVIQEEESQIFEEEHVLEEMTGRRCSNPFEEQLSQVGSSVEELRQYLSNLQGRPMFS